MDSKKLVISFFIFFLVLKADIALCAPKKDMPTRITSDIIDIKQKSSVMEFINNVVVKKGSDHMMADNMLVYYEGKTIDSENQEGSSSIKKIVAKNNVKISSADFIATGDSGYYDPKEGTFTLENNVVVNNGASIAKGDKFIYNLTSKKGNLVGEKKPLESTLNNASQKKDQRVIVIINEDDVKKQKAKNAAKNNNKK